MSILPEQSFTIDIALYARFADSQNGTAFLYQTSVSHSIFSGWWDTLSAAYRYGPLSPIRTNSAVNAMVKKFALLYNPKVMSERGAVRSTEAMADHIGLGSEMSKKKGDDWALKTVGVGEKWMQEVMEGTTRNVVSSPLHEASITAES